MKQENKQENTRTEREIYAIRRYMELNNLGLYFESLYPAAETNREDIYYDSKDFLWKGITPDGEKICGSIRNVVRRVLNVSLEYRYRVDGKEERSELFEFVLQSAVECPSTFSIQGYEDCYSKQEQDYLNEICRQLQTKQNGNSKSQNRGTKVFIDYFLGI